MAAFGDLLVDQFFRTTIVSAVSINATTVVVQSVAGFPAPVGPEYFYLTLVDDNDRAEVVRIVNVTGTTLTLATGTRVQNGFSVGSRAELWFTAEAFVDMQTYILAIEGGGGGGGGYPPDYATIDLTVDSKLKVFDEGVGTGQLADSAVTSAKILNGEVTGIKLANDSVTNLKVAGPIDGSKLSTDPAEINRDFVQNSVVRTAPTFLTQSAGLNMNHIAYTEVPAGNTPSGGNDGDIAIEWEALP
jgi:hypothetical protein